MSSVASPLAPGMLQALLRVVFPYFCAEAGRAANHFGQPSALTGVAVGIHFLGFVLERTTLDSCSVGSSRASSRFAKVAERECETS